MSNSEFLLHEVYESENDINDHLKTNHFKKWINTVEIWFSRPRDRDTYIPVSQGE